MQIVRLSLLLVIRFLALLESSWYLHLNMSGNPRQVQLRGALRALRGRAVATFQGLRGRAQEVRAHVQHQVQEQAVRARETLQLAQIQAALAIEEQADRARYRAVILQTMAGQRVRQLAGQLQERVAHGLHRLRHGRGYNHIHEYRFVHEDSDGSSDDSDLGILVTNQLPFEPSHVVPNQEDWDEEAAKEQFMAALARVNREVADKKRTKVYVKW